jgi:hypothetical protein
MWVLVNIQDFVLKARHHELYYESRLMYQDQNLKINND